MTSPDLDHLAAEIMELNRDALEAARVARLCRRAAGQRLLEIRMSMGARAFETWCAGLGCPVLASTAAAWVALAEHHAEQERDGEPV